MNLVAGATGLLGQEICRQLRAADKPVRALVRTTSSPEKVAQLQKWGASVVMGDLKDPASLDRACRGVTAVLSTASCTFSRQPGDAIDTVDRDGQLALVDSAERAGVQRFVFVSFPHFAGISFPLGEAKQAVEQRLQRSRMTHTILQANWFMEVWLSPAVGFDYASAQATIYGEGCNPLNWISYPDVARFAVAALDNPAATNRTLPIGGPDALSPLQVVRVFEVAAQRPFTVQHVPVEALQQQKAQAQDPIQESFAGLMLMAAQGISLDMTPILHDYPFSLTSGRDYAYRALKIVAEPV